MRARKAAISLSFLLLAVAAYAVWERATFDRAAWLEDYDQLRAHVSRNYANLLWVIDQRHLDVAALHQATLRRLEEAKTDRAARAALASFVSAFQDGHFRIARTRLSDRLENLFRSEAEEVAAGASAEKACAMLGFSEDVEGLSFSSTELQSLRMPENSFDAATFRLGDRTVGLLRIPIFDTRRYEGACRRAWAAQIGQRRCDADCAQAFVDFTVPNQLLSELSAQVRSLGDAGAQLLAIDITGNGGGTDWVDPAARIMTKSPLSCPQVSFIKGPHWIKTFMKTTDTIESDLAAADSSSDIAVLQAARRRAAELADRAGEVCPLDTLWTGERPSCSNIVKDAGYSACGLMGLLPPGSLAHAQSRGALFNGLAFEYEAGVFEGPLAVLVDGGTASAAEYFAAILADNDAATLAGQRTFGVGCGYTNGGVGVLLHHSALKVEMPDCQRIRRDGTNEMAGIAPQLQIEWTKKDTDAERWAKLTAALGPLVGR